MKKTKEQKIDRNNKIGKTMAIVAGGVYLLKMLKGQKDKKK